MAAPASSQIAAVLDKHLTTVVNCLLNVVYVMMLVHFFETGLSWCCVAASKVSPADSLKGFAYNLFFCSLVFSLMLVFKGTLECLILFENLQRNKDGKKETTTTIAVDKAGAQIRHVDNGSTNTTWQTIACYILNGFLNKAATNEAEPAQHEKEAATPSSTTEDEIKQDAASASSSARSTADTSDALN
jgi:hypothetical protein